MKRIFSLTLALAIFTGVAVAQPSTIGTETTTTTTTPKPNNKVETNPDAPEFKWDEETYDFGTIAKGSNPVSHKYWFTNVGKEPLIISKVDKTCGCTVPGWTKEPVAPGERGWVEAKYVATNRVGSASKSIKVHSNAKTALKVLTFKVNVSDAAVTPEQPVQPKSIFDQ